MISQLEMQEIGQRSNGTANIILKSRGIVFMTGFCLGMMFFLWKKKYIVNESGILGQELFLQLTRMSLEQYELLKYITKSRGIQFLILMLVSCSKRVNFLLSMLLSYGGFATALFMLTSVYRYDMKGLVLCFLLIFPHGIFYLILLIILFHKKLDDDTKYYHKSRGIKGIGFYKVLTEAVKWVVIIIAFAVGVIAECYINPVLVKRFAMLL